MNIDSHFVSLDRHLVVPVMEDDNIVDIIKWMFTTTVDYSGTLRTRARDDANTCGVWEVIDMGNR